LLGKFIKIGPGWSKISPRVVIVGPKTGVVVELTDDDIEDL